MAREQTMCVLCHMEEKKERIVNRLVKRRIPADLWDYFLENPGHMDLRFAFPPDKLQTDPLISSNRLTALTATTDKYISNKFLGSISAFVEATKKNVVNPNGENANKLQTKEISNNSEGDVSVKVLETDDAKVREKGISDVPGDTQETSKKSDEHTYVLRSRSLPNDDDEHDAGIHCKTNDKTGEDIIGLKNAQ